MSKFSLDPDMNFEVTARFIGKGAYAPVSGTAYSVRLFDNDLLSNDFIGESELDAKGIAKISFHHAAFGDLANLETFPDLYFVVFKNGEPIFKSKVIEDVDLEAIEQYKKGEGEVIDLGTYLINA